MLYLNYEYSAFLPTTLGSYQAFIRSVAIVYARIWNIAFGWCRYILVWLLLGYNNLCPSYHRPFAQYKCVDNQSALHVMRRVDVLSPFFQCQYSLPIVHSFLRIRPLFHTGSHDEALTASSYFPLFLRYFCPPVHPKHDGSFLTSGGAPCA